MNFGDDILMALASNIDFCQPLPRFYVDLLVSQCFLYLCKYLGKWSFKYPIFFTAAIILDLISDEGL